MSNIASLPQPTPHGGNALVAANVRAELAYTATSQGALAAHLGLSEMALSRRLSDKYSAEFSASEILLAAEFFGIDPGALFTRRPRRPGPTSGGAASVNDVKQNGHGKITNIFDRAKHPLAG